VAYADLAPVLRRAALLVHHGGIGTMAQAMLAGVPQLVLPFAYDQADNGDRARRLGAGGMLNAPHPGVDAVAAAIDVAIAQPAQPRIALRERMRASRGVAACVDAFEAVLARTPGGAPARLAEVA
jgi:UDP:flavonoid glycosyltransferase YjiC (YdhE family)